MIVPDFWAQASVKHRDRKRQVTIRRFGWSNESEADALTMAKARAEDALARVLSGVRLDRSEPVRAYNGADGVPIREEVLARHGEQVVTRNSYGAHCLNSPDTLFADIDFEPPRSTPCNLAAFAVLAALAFAAGQIDGIRPWHWLLWIVALLGFVPLGRSIAGALLQAQGGHQTRATARLKRFVDEHPGWGLRYYLTPAGMRVIATHAKFNATDPLATAFFKTVGADPRYVRMCRHQQCFRARLTGKPWRMGIDHHMRPRPGVWPVSEDKRPIREAWVRHYDAMAARFAACRYQDTLGNDAIHPDLRPVVELHDRLSGALRNGARIA